MFKNKFAKNFKWQVVTGCYRWHYKKRGLQLRLKNAVIDPKNATIGYSRVVHSRVFTHNLYCEAIAPCVTQSCVSKNTTTNHPMAVFSTPYSCAFYPLQPRFYTRTNVGPIVRFIENVAIDPVWATFLQALQAKEQQVQPIALF